jgi:hypothetical protein
MQAYAQCREHTDAALDVKIFTTLQQRKNS